MHAARPLLLALVLCACGGPVPPEMPNPPPPYFEVNPISPRQGGSVGEALQVLNALRAHPELAKETLARHNLTAEAWDALLYKIAADPKSAEALNDEPSPAALTVAAPGLETEVPATATSLLPSAPAEKASIGPEPPSSSRGAEAGAGGQE